jgi:phage virion morphogenesis protein
MVGVSVRIDIEDRLALAALQAAAAGLGDLGPVMRDIGEALMASSQDRFDAQVSPSGAAWAPLRPSTLRARRAKKISGTKILIARGDLKGLIRYQLDGQSGVLVGTDRQYGAVQQFGADIQQYARSQRARFKATKVTAKDGTERTVNRFAKRGKGKVRWVTIGEHVVKIPARPFLGVSAADQVEILAIIADHLADGGGEAASHAG